jgi:hypothetical protein
MPSVQTKLATKLTNYLQETYNTEIAINRIGLNWRGEIDAREIYIADHHQDTLIYGEQLQTNILSFANIIKGVNSFGNIKLTKAKFYVKTYKDEDNDNLSVFADKFDSGTEEISTFKLFGDDVVIVNSHIEIIDENLSDPLLFDLTNVNLTAENFEIIGSEVFASVQSLRLSGARGFDIKALKTKFSYTLEEMILKDLELQTAQSVLIGDVVMNYGANGFSEFENTVILTGNFKESKIATNDLNGFYNEFGANQTINFSGNVQGTLNDFSFTNGRIRSGNTRVAGDFYFMDILEGADAFNINFKRHIIRTSYYDLRRFFAQYFRESVTRTIKEIRRF